MGDALHKVILCKGLSLRYRLTTTAADKASVLREFKAEAREEEEAVEGERCGTEKKMTRGNGTMAHRNS